MRHTRHRAKVGQPCLFCHECHPGCSVRASAEVHLRRSASWCRNARAYPWVVLVPFGAQLLFAHRVWHDRPAHLPRAEPQGGFLQRGHRAGIILVIFAILIGISRIYVGVHWPANVLGGWLLAGMWRLSQARFIRLARAKWCYQKRPKSSPNNNKRSCLSGIYQRGFTTETK